VRALKKKEKNGRENERVDKGKTEARVVGSESSGNECRQPHGAILSHYS
jgi:hypothetical protein